MSMAMCDDRHEPVIYTKWDHRNIFHKCPVCEVLDREARLKEAVKFLNDRPQTEPYEPPV